MSTRIRGFDGLRALAVLAVFFSHRFAPLYDRALGHAGVLVFFALSGFLIVGILTRARESIEAGASSYRHEIKAFFGHRFRRILPVYFAMLVVVSALALVGHPVTGWRWDSLPWHALFGSHIYQSYVLGGWQGSLAHLWSLSIEFWFYALAAPLLLALPSRWHLIACEVVMLAGLGGHVALMMNGSSHLAVYTDTLTNFGFIAMGGAIALNLQRTRAMHWALLPLIPVLIALSLMPDPMAYGPWMIVTPILAGLLVLAVAHAQTGLVVALLERPALVYMGRISYGFYLFHKLFWLSTPWHGPVDVLASMALNFVASFALAAVSWELFENPILKGCWPWQLLGRQPRRVERVTPEAVVAAGERP